MIKEFPDRPLDVCLITTSELDLGVRTLSSFLKQKGLRVAVGFFNAWGLYRPEELETIAQWVRACNPRVIGISSVEFSRERTIQLLESLRKTHKPVVAGGADPTLNPAIYLRYADYVIRGEGEYPLLELISGLAGAMVNNDIPNLCYMDAQGNVRINNVRPLLQNLDDLPFADWLGFSHHYILNDGSVCRKDGFASEINDPQIPALRKGIYVMTARGCSFECNFCINAELKRLNPGEQYIRKRSIMPVIGRIEELQRADPAIDIVYFFDDDLFLRSCSEIALFAAEWKKRIKLPFYANCTPLTVQEEKLHALVDAGLLIVTMGIQSGSERVNREIFGRKGDNVSIMNAAALLHAYVGKGKWGLVPPKYDFIINNIYESEADLLQDIRLLMQLPTPFSAEMHSMKLFQGTQLYQRAVRDHIVTGKDESTKYNCHDALNNLRLFLRQGGNYYLNSLLYWMNGNHTGNIRGIVPVLLVPWLTESNTIRYFNRRTRLISWLNHMLPTQKRIFNWKQKFLRYCST